MTLGAVMLNWKRPENVETITKSWVNFPLFERAIVWGNLWPLPSIHNAITTIHSTADLGLYTRFHAGILTRCDAVFMQDDDLLIPRATIVQLYNKWRAEPDIIHGLFGRVPRGDNQYAQSYDNDTRECDIVLTRTLIVSAKLLRQFMVDAQQFLHMQAVTYGNGEDIILSYVATKYSGRKNKIWKLPRKRLLENDSLYQRQVKTHFSHRTRVMQACQKWIKGEDE
jgi:hypothetical protein